MKKRGGVVEKWIWWGSINLNRDPDIKIWYGASICIDPIAHIVGGDKTSHTRFSTCIKFNQHERKAAYRAK